MLATESDLRQIEERLGGKIPPRVRHILMTQLRGEVYREWSANSIIMYGFNSVDPSLRTLEHVYGELATGVLPVGLAWGPSSEFGIYLPDGSVIDLHGQPDRPRKEYEYGEPFRGEWRVIANDIETFLERVEQEGLFFIRDNPGTQV